MSENSIFIQIASYRDPELVPTLDSLFANAEFPDNLTVCVAWQHSIEDEWDDLGKYKKDQRVKILDIPYNKTLGACWARNLIQQEYNNEKYTLQLDSHHRFVKNWDTKLITMYENLQKLGHKKPLLTTYATAYDPNNFDINNKAEVWGMKFDRFTPEGVVFFLPYTIEDTSKPLPARFYSAHFVFTTGKHAEEVQHDPSFYFHGEEITLAVRSFTHGYDLFHPNEIIAYHEYTRTGRTKHWDDDSTWVEKNTHTHSRVRQLLGVDGEVCTPCNEKHFGVYGLGKERTLEDYEEYSGIRFKDRAIRQSCLNNHIPTLGKKDELYYPKFSHILNLHGNQFQYNDYTFCAIIFEDEKKKELYRKDITNLNHLIKNKDNFNIPVESNTKKPANIVVWAYSKSKGWAERLDIVI